MYDPARRQDILAASMYFNTMSSKTEHDNFFDRLVQAKSLIALYKEHLSENRELVRERLQQSKVAKWEKDGKRGKRPKVAKGTGKVGYTEVVNWLGIRGELLTDGDIGSSDETTIGVIVRIASMCPEEVMQWFTKKLETAKRSTDRKCYNLVLAGRYMSSHIIWHAEPDVPRSVLDPCTHECFLFSVVCLFLSYACNHTCNHTCKGTLRQEVLVADVHVQEEGVGEQEEQHRQGSQY